MLALAMLMASTGEVWARGSGAAVNSRAAVIAEAARLNTEVVRLSGEGAYAKAMPLAQRAVTLREGALGPEHPDTAASLNSLAALYQAQGAYTRAEPLSVRALAIREKALGKEHPFIAASLNNLAELYRAQGAFAKAEPLYVRARAIYEKALGREHPFIAASLNNLAELYRAQGAFAEAEPLLLRALAIFEKTLEPEHPDTAILLNNLAELYQAQGAFAKAEPLYVRARAIREKALGSEHPGTAILLNNLAELYRAQGAFAKAEPFYVRALAIYEKTLEPEHPDTAIVLNNLAELYRAQGAYAKAEPLLLRARAIYEKTLEPEHPGTAASLNNLAELYRAQGAFAKAEPLLLQALAIREKALGPDHPDTAQSLNSLAALYRAQGAYAKAEPLLLRARAIREKTLGPDHPDTAASLNNLAELYRAQGAFAQAEPLYVRARAIYEKALGKEHPDTGASLNNLAFLYQAQGAFAQAEPLYVRALAIREKALGKEHPDNVQSLTNLASLHWARGERRPALDLLARAAAARERLLRAGLVALSPARQRQWLATLRGQAELAASFHAHGAPDDPDALRLAVAAALGHKGRVLDELAGARRALRRNLTPALRAEFDALAEKQAELAALREAARPEQAEARKALEDEVDRREAELGRTSAAFRAQAAPVTVERVQASLLDDTALVEFVRYHRLDAKRIVAPWAEARYVAYVLRRDGPPRWADLGEAAPIEGAVRTARQALARPAADARAPLRELDRRLLDPVRRVLGSELPAHLLVAPDGVLHLVPFGALVDEKGEHLVESTLVTQLGSGRDLLRMGEGLPPRSGPLVLAAPDFGPGAAPFAPLPGAVAEAEAVRSLFPEARVLPGKDATRQALLGVQGPRFALLATHGFLNHPGLPVEPAASRPLPPPPPHERGPTASFVPPDEGVDPEWALERAGLALANANTRVDGVIRGHDLARLDLAGTKLVVLSACETGLGQLEDGEGVYGLRRALTIAGAEAQVVSLWNVNDASTSALMGTYFGALRGGAGRSEALRRAQLGLLKQERYRHPYYWAAFVASGDWRPLESGGVVPRERPGGACGCRMAGAEGPSGGASGAAVTLLALAAGRRRRAARAAAARRGRVGRARQAMPPGRARVRPAHKARAARFSCRLRGPRRHRR